MLMCSLAAWIVFNVPLGFIHTPPTACLTYNTSGFFIQTVKASRLVKRSIVDDDLHPLDRHLLSIDGFGRDAGYFPDDLLAIQRSLTTSTATERGLLGEFQDFGASGDEHSTEDLINGIPWDELMKSDSAIDVPLNGQRYVRVRRQSPMKPTHEVGKSPYSLEFAVNYEGGPQSNWVSPTFSYTIYSLNDVRKVFFLFLLLIVVGEFFCCPSLTLADSAVLAMLGKESADQYGRQRMFASIGWGLTMFFVCLTLDHSHTFTDHPCQVATRRHFFISFIQWKIHEIY